MAQLRLVNMIWVPFCLAICGGATQISAEPLPDEIGAGDFDAAQAVVDQTLDSLRGGYVLGNNVTLSIGVQQTHSIDGIQQSQSGFQVENIDLTGKTFNGSVSDLAISNISPAVNTFIQNNLDNKTIQDLTVVDVAIKNLDVSALQQSVLGSRAIEAAQDMQSLH